MDEILKHETMLKHFINVFDDCLALHFYWNSETKTDTFQCSASDGLRSYLFIHHPKDKSSDSKLISAVNTPDLSVFYSVSGQISAGLVKITAERL